MYTSSNSFDNYIDDAVIKDLMQEIFDTSKEVIQKHQLQML